MEQRYFPPEESQPEVVSPLSPQDSASNLLPDVASTLSDAPTVTQESLNDLAARLEQEARSGEFWSPRGKAVRWTLFVALFLMFSAWIPNQIFGTLFMSACLTYSLSRVTSDGLTLLTMRRHRRRKERSKTVAALAATNDPRALGLLVETAQKTKNIPLLSEIVPALTRLLPALNADNAELLTETQWEGLYGLLQSAPDATGTRQEAIYRTDYTDFTLALLDALERLGEDRALPFVERLEALDTVNGDQERMQVAAQAWLTRWRERAGWVSASAVPTQVVELSDDTLKAAQREATACRNWSGRLFQISIKMAAVSMVGVLSINYLLHPTLQPYSESSFRLSNTLMSLCLFVQFLGLGGFLLAGLRRPKSNSALHRLWSSEDVRAVGPLLEATQMEVPQLTPRAVQALTRLLPRLQASDASLLDARQRAILHHTLAQNPRFGPITRLKREYILAILTALQQVGNEKAIPSVERLAAGEGLARKERRIQEAAQACLPFLKARVEQTQAHQTFLRAADRPAPAADTLLRPASGGTETEPEVLLRASNKDQA